MLGEALPVGILDPLEADADVVLRGAEAGDLADPDDLAGGVHHRVVERQPEPERELLADLELHRRREAYASVAQDRKSVV